MEVGEEQTTHANPEDDLKENSASILTEDKPNSEDRVKARLKGSENNLNQQIARIPTVHNPTSENSMEVGEEQTTHAKKDEEDVERPAKPIAKSVCRDKSIDTLGQSMNETEGQLTHPAKEAAECADMKTISLPKP